MRVIESFEDDVQVIERSDGLLRFRWVKAPSSSELTHLTETLAPRSRRNSRAVSSGWDCRCFRAMASQEAHRIAEQNGDDKGLKRVE